MKTLDLYNVTDQRIVRKLVDREVLYCVSNLISRLCELEPDDEELMALCEVRDYETPLEAVEDEQWERLCANNDLSPRSKERVIAALGAEECCEQLGLDPDYREVYEHWLVTSWAADSLREKGEVVVDDLHGLTVWGRTATGQAICMDRVWWEIARDMEILSGQANSWEEGK